MLCIRIFRDRKDALHVFISADDEFRKAYILEHYGETKQKPERRLAEKDKKRRLNYEFYTEREWGNPANYHLVLNSGKLGIEKTVNLILAAYRQNWICKRGCRKNICDSPLYI